MNMIPTVNVQAQSGKTLRTNPSKIALVSRNTLVVFDYASYLQRIVRICEDQGVNMIVYSMWSYDHRSQQVGHDDLFGETRSVETVILESCNVPLKSDCRTLVWSKGDREPRILCQRFARSTESSKHKQAFIDDFEKRRVGSCFIILCGETNIVTIRMHDGGVTDEFGFLERLARGGVSIILNPIHDYMKRHEMKKKRAVLSHNKRWVLSVWNKGKKGETAIPWTAFYDGQDMTAFIREVQLGIPSVRMGIAALDSIRV